MTFSDFKANFHKVEICNLSPEELGDDMKDKSKRKWEVSVQEGAWKKNVNAGGCINNRGITSCVTSRIRAETKF